MILEQIEGSQHAPFGRDSVRGAHRQRSGSRRNRREADYIPAADPQLQIDIVPAS
jgi:hypothetical protein